MEVNTQGVGSAGGAALLSQLSLLNQPMPNLAATSIHHVCLKDIAAPGKHCGLAMGLQGAAMELEELHAISMCMQHRSQNRHAPIAIEVAQL